MVTPKLARLTEIDYLNLLTLASGILIGDADTSIRRLLAAGLISRHQQITPAGNDKVIALRAAEQQICDGLPLSKRLAHRANDAIQAITQKASYYGTDYYFNDHVIVAGERRELIYAEEDLEAWQTVRKEVSRLNKMEPTSWFKLDAYAVQRGGLTGPELVCLRARTRKNKYRIQSMYYDYISDQFRSASWWFTHRHDILAVKLEHPIGKSMKHNTIALVMPVACELPFPEEE